MLKRNNLLIIPLLFITLFTSCFKDGDDVKYTDNNDYNQEVPNGDYIQGKTKTELKTAWNKKLSDTYIHSSYSQVWQAYYTTDIRNDGYVDDIYGGPTTKYTVGADQQTGSTTKGKYNREHTFPKSWFGTQDQNYDMYTDLYHVLPCDYEANEARWNYPYGEVKTENWSNGYCKRGTMTVSGFNGVVFEPNDEIKGDIARIYFYMATRYEHESMSIWGNAGSNALLYNKYPFYKTWLVNILLKWHENDPVSEREIKRNNAVEKLQGNRNPFVDYPELVEYIWGGTTADKDKTDKKFFYINTAAGKEIEYLY